VTTTTLAGPRRSVAGRATLAALLLLGFYLLGFAIIGTLAAINIAFFANGRVPVRITIFSVIVAFALLRGMFFVEKRGGADEITGLAVTDADEPRLWALIREIAQQLGTDPPARVYLVPDVNAFVTQRSKLMGLVPGERIMGIGLPLLHVLTVDELRGVLAHEFGHYTGGDTRLGPLVYRGRASIGRTIGHLGADSLLATVFTTYGKLYLRVSQAVSRRQELDADANAARVAGPAAHASALRKVHVADPVFDTFIGRFVQPLWNADARPRALYAGFEQFHDHPDHEESLARVAARMEEREGDRYDSHPALRVRLAALGDVPAEAEDGDRARTLLADADQVDERMSLLVSRLGTESNSLRAVEWDDAAAETMLAPVVRQDQARLYAAVSTLTGAEPTVGAALDLVEAGRVVELATAIDQRVATVPEEDRLEVSNDLVADLLAGAVGAALTTERGWRWGLRWSGPAALVAPTGKPWDYGKAVYDAVGDPANLPALRKKLRATGIAA